MSTRCWTTGSHRPSLFPRQHLAIELRAPDSLIVSLLEANPDAASVPGRDGKYPVHMASQRNIGSKAVVELIRAYPEALDKRDDQGQLPCDYPQRSDLCREALTRPSVCWIEDIEKEDYLSRVEERRNQLRQKLTKLRNALDISKGRTDRIKNILRTIEPRLEEQQQAMKMAASTQHQIREFEDNAKRFLDEVRSRVKSIGEDTDETDEELRTKVVKKRAYMQGKNEDRINAHCFIGIPLTHTSPLSDRPGVQKQYEKLLTKTDQIQGDLQAIRSMLPISNGGEISPSLSKSRSFA